MKNKGFSLVELSIVLVILGLLTGGILTGQSLIRAAQLRAITTELAQYQAAVNTFQEKYYALPGDMPNATQYWGSANGATCAHNSTGTGNGTQTCNGDGNGKLIHIASSGNVYVEMFMFWQHLANAKLLTGNFSGKAGSSGDDHAIIRQNVPASRVANAGWSIINNLLQGHGSHINTNTYGTNYIFPLVFGGQRNGNELYTPVLTTSEAWNIDTKIDDGIGSTGSIVLDMRVENVSCRNTATPISYELNNSNIACVLFFKQ